MQGISHSNKGDYGNAINYFNIAISLNPYNSYNANAYFNRGVIYSRQRQNELALSDFSQAIDIDENFSNAYVGRCNIYNVKKKYDLAIVDCTKAIELGTSEMMAYSNRGLAYVAQGRYQLAVSDLTEVIKSKTITLPRRAYNYCLLGATYTNIGDFPSAITSFKEGIKLDSKGKMSWCKIALENAQQGKRTTIP